jgi:hypothetical protein
VADWCETPKPALSHGGLDYDDFHLHTDLSLVAKSVDYNCYRQIPFKISDPVLQAAEERLDRFLMSHHHNNLAGHCAIMGGECLAIRGYNVPKMIWQKDIGGLGKSLRSRFRARAMGPHLHRYVDPNVFFVEEELRKCGGRHSTACAWTFQEMLQTRTFSEVAPKAPVHVHTFN